jgi:hypothetical protein
MRRILRTIGALTLWLWGGLWFGLGDVLCAASQQQHHQQQHGVQFHPSKLNPYQPIRKPRWGRIAQRSKNTGFFRLMLEEEV